jgi:hypothetical protein
VLSQWQQQQFVYNAVAAVGMPQQQQVLQSNRGILKKVSTAETPSMDLLQARRELLVNAI